MLRPPQNVLREQRAFPDENGDAQEFRMRFANCRLKLTIQVLESGLGAESLQASCGVVWACAHRDRAYAKLERGCAGPLPDETGTETSEMLCRDESDKITKCLPRWTTDAGWRAVLFARDVQGR